MSIRQFHYQEREEDSSSVSLTERKSDEGVQVQTEEVNVYDELQKILFKLPMPRHIPRLLHLRGSKKSHYTAITAKAAYAGCAHELLSLIRLMKFYFFIADPLQEWREIKDAIIKLFTDKRIFGLSTISR